MDVMFIRLEVFNNVPWNVMFSLLTIFLSPRCCHRGHDSLQHSSSVAGQHGFCSSITWRQETLVSSALEANADIDPHQEGLQTAQAVAAHTSASSLKTWRQPSWTGQNFFDKTNLDPEPCLCSRSWAWSLDWCFTFPSVLSTLTKVSRERPSPTRVSGFSPPGCLDGWGRSHSYTDVLPIKMITRCSEKTGSSIIPPCWWETTWVCCCWEPGRPYTPWTATTSLSKRPW